MYYLVYKITNKINSKSYIGVHQTKNKNDDYMGSGELIKRAIKKYGINNFIKEIIFEATNSEEMFSKEKELVDINSNSYNLREGGVGGFGYINTKRKQDKNFNDVIRKKLSKASKNFWEKHPEHRKKISNFMKERNKIHPYRCKHTEEFKKRIGKLNSIRNKGVNNPNYGKQWITNGKENKMIPIYYLIPLGWKKGRLTGN